VQGVEKGTAEEFFSRLLANAHILHEASAQFAADGDSVSAIACAIGSDAATLESVVWERLNIAPRAPQRQFFQAVATVASSLGGLVDLGEADVSTAIGFVSAVRERMIQAFDADLAHEVAERWGPLAHLADLLMPLGLDMDDFRAQRLEGMRAPEFIKARRAASGQAMLQAQNFRVRGMLDEAVQSAYESDYLAMEAYLVESAMAAGDTALLTVVARAVLVSDSLADMSGLPADFTEAVSAIRGAMADGLGEADGARLRAALIDLP
jgi:hypothetical protein